MRAVQLHEFGGPEVLEAVETEAPEPGPGQVAVDVAYAGVNFADLKARAEGYRVPDLPFVPGLEVAGRVRAVGAGVEGVEAGQEVAALTAGGAYAEVAVADAATVFPVPAGVGLRTAATLPTVLPTAHALLHEVGRLRAGETVLVQGAAGGVGTVVGQLAKAAGATVFGVVSSAAKAEYAGRYGYDEVFVDSGAGFAAAARAATGGRGVDLALDPVGGDAFRAGLDALATFGRLVSYGNASSAEPWRVGQAELFPGTRSVACFSILTLAKEDPRALRALAERAFEAVADGTVTLPVTAEFALEEAAEAHALMGGRTTTGKLLLRVNPAD
ncbi:Quinone oxidoreductase 1 [Streptomyces sp. YIM 121038]|uniref:quinone oxidoreductase family protein n=1 Tax=Streptomyces sp. YIM 121038 TaxID=2136401 RepID=UPI0011104100|nr:zinc-binding dehydrogenase [Streptomyces sp. YIM 121038]QCX78383.1 Quinone oxidoreductase 1 [Streptomyces sp. YIM 121038]